MVDPYQTREYARFVESMAEHCHCRPPFDRPCSGVLAGGLCDDMGTSENEDPDYKNPDRDEDY